MRIFNRVGIAGHCGVTLSGSRQYSERGGVSVYRPLQAILKADGGESGIRTHGTVSRTHAFQACALSHSAISPEALS